MAPGRGLDHPELNPASRARGPSVPRRQSRGERRATNQAISSTGHLSIPQWPRVIQAMQRASCPMRRAALGHARPCPSERRGAAGGPWSAPTHSRRHVGCCPKEVTAIARVPVASGRVPGCSRDTRSPAVVLERGRNRPPFSFAPPHPGIVVAKRIDHRES